MQNLEAFLFEEACRLEHTAALQARVQNYLKAQRILLPAESTLIRIIGEQRQRARERIYEQITADLPGKVAGVLDELLQVPLGEKASPLQRIKANPRNPSPEAMLALLQKLQLIETTGILQVDLSWLSGNYQRALFHYVNQCSIDRLREVVQPRRNAALMCFLWQSYRDAVDQAVDMYDKLITWVHTQAEADLDEQLRQQRKALRSSLATLKSLGAIILDEQIADVKLRARLFEKVPRDELAALVGRRSALGTKFFPSTFLYSVSPFPIGEKLTVIGDLDAIALGIRHLLNVHFKVDGTHNAIAKHLMNECLNSGAIDLRDLVESVDQRINRHRLM
jgi:hypothetical protein